VEPSVTAISSRVAAGRLSADRHAVYPSRLIVGELQDLAKVVGQSLDRVANRQARDEGLERIALGGRIAELGSLVPGPATMQIDRRIASDREHVAAHRAPAGVKAPGHRLLLLERRRGRRLDVGRVPWLRQQFDFVQETPYRFHDVPPELERPASCELERGKRDNPLFLLNHWIDTSPAPRVTLARQANSRRLLLGRARRCQKLRNLLPNLVVVDLYREGDLFDVA